MTNRFSSQSQIRLDTCVEPIRGVLQEALRRSKIDFGIACGHRGEQGQNDAYNAGNSKLQFPHSKHNIFPSNAVDIYAWVNGKADWSAKYYYYIAGIIDAVAEEQDVDIRWGGNWDSDGDFSDNSFNDLGHFEIL